MSPLVEFILGVFILALWARLDERAHRLHVHLSRIVSLALLVCGLGFLAAGAIGLASRIIFR